MQAALALRVPLAPGGPRVEMGSSQSCAHAFCGADGAGDEVTRLRSTKKLGHVQRALDSLVHCGGGKRAGGESSGTAAEPDAPGTSGSSRTHPAATNDLTVHGGDGCLGPTALGAKFYAEEWLVRRINLLALAVSACAALTGDMMLPLIPLHFAAHGLEMTKAAEATAALPLLRLLSAVLASRGVLQGATLQNRRPPCVRLLRTLLPALYAAIGCIGFSLIAVMPTTPWAYIAFGACMGPSMETLSCVQKLMTQRFPPTSKRGAKSRAAAANLWISFQGGSAISFVISTQLYDRFDMQVVIYAGFSIQIVLFLLCAAFSLGAAVRGPHDSPLLTPRGAATDARPDAAEPAPPRLAAASALEGEGGEAVGSGGAAGSVAGAASRPGDPTRRKTGLVKGSLRQQRVGSFSQAKRTSPITVWPSIPIYMCLLLSFFGFGVIYFAMCAGSATYFRNDFGVSPKAAGFALAGSTAAGVIGALLLDKGWAPTFLTKTPLDLLANLLLGAVGSVLYCSVPVFAVGVLGQAMVITAYTLGVGCLVKTIQCYVPEATRGKQVVVGMACRLFGQAVGGAAAVALRSFDQEMLPVLVGGTVMALSFAILTMLFVQRLVHLETMAFALVEGTRTGVPPRQPLPPAARAAAEARGATSLEGVQLGGTSAEAPAAADDRHVHLVVDFGTDNKSSSASLSELWRAARRFARSSNSLYELEVEHAVKCEARAWAASSASKSASPANSAKAPPPGSTAGGSAAGASSAEEAAPVIQRVRTAPVTLSRPSPDLVELRAPPRLPPVVSELGGSNTASANASPAEASPPPSPPPQTDRAAL